MPLVDVAEQQRDGQSMSVAEAARLLGRDRTRVYALPRSGDLVAADPDADDMVDSQSTESGS